MLNVMDDVSTKLCVNGEPLLSFTVSCVCPFPVQPVCLCVTVLLPVLSQSDT